MRRIGWRGCSGPRFSGEDAAANGMTPWRLVLLGAPGDDPPESIRVQREAYDRSTAPAD